MRCSSDLPTSLVDGMSADAITAQDAAVAAAQARGHRHIGYKIAVLEAAAQTRMGADGPVWGVLTTDMALVDGATFDLAGVTSARAEVELVFQLGHDLVGPGVTEADVLAATHALHIGIELPSIPLGEQPATDIETFTAHNAFAGRYVLGRAVLDIAALDLTLIGALVDVDGEIVGSGCGARVLGSPARAVAWLANRLALRGRELNAGMIVFAGALADSVGLATGQTVSVEIAHLGRAAIRVS